MQPLDPAPFTPDGAVHEAWTYPLFDAILQRRARRFPLGATMPGQEQAFVSPHAPIPPRPRGGGIAHPGGHRREWHRFKRSPLCQQRGVRPCAATPCCSSPGVSMPVRADRMGRSCSTLMIPGCTWCSSARCSPRVCKSTRTQTTANVSPRACRNTLSHCSTAPGDSTTLTGPARLQSVECQCPREHAVHAHY